MGLSRRLSDGCAAVCLFPDALVSCVGDATVEAAYKCNYVNVTAAGN
jgi:hypothetical protein